MLVWGGHELAHLLRNPACHSIELLSICIELLSLCFDLHKSAVIKAHFARCLRIDFNMTISQVHNHFKTPCHEQQSSNWRAVHKYHQVKSHSIYGKEWALRREKRDFMLKTHSPSVQKITERKISPGDFDIKPPHSRRNFFIRLQRHLLGKNKSVAPNLAVTQLSPKCFGNGQRKRNVSSFGQGPYKKLAVLYWFSQIIRSYDTISPGKKWNCVIMEPKWRRFSPFCCSFFHAHEVQKIHLQTCWKRTRLKTLLKTDYVVGFFWAKWLFPKARKEGIYRVYFFWGEKPMKNELVKTENWYNKGLFYLRIFPSKISAGHVLCEANRRQRLQNMAWSKKKNRNRRQQRETQVSLKCLLSSQVVPIKNAISAEAPNVFASRKLIITLSHVWGSFLAYMVLKISYCNLTLQNKGAPCMSVDKAECKN